MTLLHIVLSFLNSNCQVSDDRDNETPEDEIADDVEDVDSYIFVREHQLACCSFKDGGHLAVEPHRLGEGLTCDGSSQRNWPPL